MLVRARCRGRGSTCPSAPELWRLNWAVPIATITPDNCDSGLWYMYNLPATYKDPENMLRVGPQCAAQAS